MLMSPNGTYTNQNMSGLGLLHIAFNTVYMAKSTLFNFFVKKTQNISLNKIKLFIFEKYSPLSIKL